MVSVGATWIRDLADHGGARRFQLGLDAKSTDIRRAVVPCHPPATWTRSQRAPAPEKLSKMSSIGRRLPRFRAFRYRIGKSPAPCARRRPELRISLRLPQVTTESGGQTGDVACTFPQPLAKVASSRSRSRLHNARGEVHHCSICVVRHKVSQAPVSSACT